jgi:exopolysaccharide production protein ExoZ
LLPVRDATGVIRPVLPVGWTLTYEMLFYLLVATALMLRAPLGRVCVPVLLVFAGLAFIVPTGGFANTIAVEFLFGVAIGNGIPWLQSLRPMIGVIAGLTAFVLLLVVPVGADLARPLTWGIPAACIVGAVVSTEMSIRQHLPRWLLAAGNASYATYLTHGFVVPGVFILCFRSISLDWAGLGATIIVSLVVSAVVGHVTHLLVEQPVLLRLRTRRPISTLPAAG